MSDPADEPPVDAVWEMPINAPPLIDDPWAPINAARLAELRAMPYVQYRDTPEWRSRRREMLHWREHRCERCGRHSEHLHVHHRTYGRFGNEQPEDLEVLCGKCHQQEHGLQR